ncbi:MAG: TonB-dependent receptor family protein [Flavobacteriales bacterium]
MKNLPLHIFIWICSSALGQQTVLPSLDTIGTLDTIQISAKRKLAEHGWLEGVQEGVIMHGKKTDFIRPSEGLSDLSSNASRQIFAKTAGIFTLESDASGIQTNISSRGLSPNRSWEFNMRQNGVDMTPDAFGYPEAYYTPPIEAVERVEILRGAAGLQFGPQFGGMVNYVMKNGKQFQRSLGYEGRQTGGSFGLWDSYNSVGGQKGAWNYFGFYHHRSGQSFREHGDFKTQSGHLALEYAPNKNFNLGGSVTQSDMLSQQPGGITDAQFQENIQQSSRSRNWFETPWRLAEFHVNWNKSSTLSVHVKAFGILAERKSVGYLKSILIADTINAGLGSYNPRQVDVDEYASAGMETRLVKSFFIHGQSQSLTIGARASRSHTLRNQKGIGSVLSDADFSTTSAGFERSLNFATNNYAVFAEQLFKVGKRWLLTPGLRIEHIENTRAGHLTWDMNPLEKVSKSRLISLTGLGAEFSLKHGQLYANASQAYRPVTFSEITPSSTTEEVDSTLKDARGYSADLGYRGKLFDRLTWDINVFFLVYENRIGSVPTTTGTFKTNIGSSQNLGTEFLIQYEGWQSKQEAVHFWKFSSYLSGSLQKAQYTRWDNPALIGNAALEIKGKYLEYAPTYQLHLGTEFKFDRLRAQIIGHAVSSVFTDAANTSTASSNAQVGKLEAYQLLDVTLSVECTKYMTISTGVNNLFDERYATRRTGGYPGPGLLPSAGRTAWLTLAIKI